MKIRSTIAACAASILALTSVNAANEINMTTHGSACQATSLGQAINFGASWSAKGVRNANTVESGKSFFVVCPMDLIGQAGVTSETPGNGGAHYVFPTYQDLSTEVAECTFRRYTYGGTLITSVAGTPISATPNANTQLNYIAAANLLDPSGTPLQYGGDNLSVVCAVKPQTTITAVGSFGPTNPPTP